MIGWCFICDEEITTPEGFEEHEQKHKDGLDMRSYGAHPTTHPNGTPIVMRKHP